jgi:hypothetical protein
MHILRDEIPGPAVEIRKIAPPAPGDQNLPSHLPVVFQQRHPSSALSGDTGAHQPRRPSPQNNHIELAQSLKHSVSSE